MLVLPPVPAPEPALPLIHKGRNVARVHKQAELGLRWLTCGARLFRRNARLLAALGCAGAVAMAALAAIPLIGIPLAGLLVPTLVGALYLALHAGAQPAARAPARGGVLKAAVRTLGEAVADERRLMLLVVLGLCCMAVTLLATMLVAQLAGSAWWIRSDVDALMAVRFAGAALLALLVASVAAAALVYALPLALLQREALLGAAARSLRAAARHAWALAVLELVLLLPILLGVIVFLFAPALAYLVAVGAVAIVLPLVIASLYCSYRTLFPVPAARSPAKPAAAAARTGARRA